MNYYLFRISAENTYVKEQLKKGYLRQGWGTKDLSFLDLDNNLVSKETWINNFPKFWQVSKEYIGRKYDNLKLMMNMKIGDIIIIPKFPTYDSFTVGKVLETYKFVEPEVNINDFYHLIKLDFNSMRAFKYNLDDNTKAIHKRLRAYQSPLNNVKNIDVQKACDNLLQMKSTMEISPIEDILKTNLEDNLNNIKDKIYNFRPNDIEKLVEKLFVTQGYEVEKRNKYNRKGGDADLILTKHLPILDEVDYDNSYDKIYVQIKHKNGNNYGDREGIDQLLNIVTDLEENVNVYKVLVCTGCFTEELRELAKEKNIILMDGLQLTRLILKFL